MRTLKTFFNKVKGDDKLVVSLVLIAIAVGLCIIFRNEINTLMKSLFESMTSTIEAMYSGTISKP